MSFVFSLGSANLVRFGVLLVAGLEKDSSLSLSLSLSFALSLSLSLFFFFWWLTGGPGMYVC